MCPVGQDGGKIISDSRLLDLLQILLYRLPSVLSGVKPVLANGILRREVRSGFMQRDVHLRVGKSHQSDSRSGAHLPAWAGLFVNGAFSTLARAMTLGLGRGQICFHRR